MASTNEERKKNSVLEYPKRIAKSIAFGAIDAVSDEFPILSNLINSNREAAKEVYDDVFNMNRNINKLKTLQDKLIFKPANMAMQNFKDSLASGEFYSTTRKEAMDNFAMGLMMESMMADEMDEDTMAMLNGEEVLGQDPNGTGQPDVKIKGIPEVTKGDTIIASVLAKEMRTGTNCLAKAVSVTTDAHIQTVRTIGNLLLEQNQQHSHTVKAGLNEIINGINGITQFNENILLQHAKNSLQFYDTMTHLTQENNAILKEMVEMQRNLYSGQLGQQKPGEGQGPAAVFANGGFNLKDYVKVVTQNVNEKTLLGPALQFISMAPMLIADAVANPLHFLTKQGMKTILGPQLRLAMNDLDASIMNYLRIGLAKLSRFGKSNKPGSIIGQIFGYEPERQHLSTIDTSKLGKNARQWDMDDHLALTKAIPMFLSNIESALTGNKARYFDFTTKKFESIRKVEQAQNNRAVQDAKIAGGQAQAMIEQTLSTLFKPKNNEELVMRNKALTEFFTGMAKANGFNREDIEKHPEKYGGAAIADIVLRIADSNKQIGRELMGTHAKLLEMAEARANAIKSGNLTDALSDAELTYAMGGHRTKNQFSSHSNSIAGKIDAISVGTKTNSLLEDILGVVTNIRDNMGGRGRRGRGSNGPRITPPNIPPSSGGPTDTDSIEDLQSISATDVGSLDLASYGIDESKIDKSDPVNKKLITMIKNYSQLISERWDRGRHGNTGSTDTWLHYITQQDKLLRYLKYRITEAKRYNGKVSVTEDDFDIYTADYMSNQANFDPKFLATIDWSQFADDEDYRKNIIGKAKLYESIRNDNFYGGLFGDQKDYRIQSDLGYLLSGKNKKGENLSKEEMKEMLNKTGTHIEDASEHIQAQIEANRIYAKQGLLGGIFGTTGENRDYAERIKEATGDANLANADIFTQLTNAANMGAKLAVINANIDEIVKAPRTMLTTVIKSADSIMYDFFFGKETEVKDKDGKPVKGLFNRMTFEMGQTMEKLNSNLDDIFSNKGDWLGKLNDTINNWFGIDIKGSYQKGRAYIRDKIIDPTRKSIKETAVNTFDEVSDAVTGTIDDAFNTNLTRKNQGRREKARRKAARAEMSDEERRADILREHQEKEAEKAARKARKKAAKKASESTGEAAAGDTGVSGKNFLSKNELLTGNQGIYQIEKSGLYDLGKGKYNVIPGNLNPFISSASRSAYSINANKANENRLRSSMMNRLQQGDSNLAAKLFPGYAEGTPKYHEVEEDRSRLLQVISTVAPQLLNNATGGEANELIDMILGYAQAAGKDPFEILLGIIQYSGGMVGDAGRKIGVPDSVKNFFTKELIKTHESDYIQENDDKRILLEQFMRSAGYQGKFDTKENIRNRKYESRGGVSDRIRQFMDTAFGADPVQAADETRKYVTENTGSILKGGLGGALASAVFPLGGPLMGAIAGASAKLLSNNSSFMNYVFGTATGEEEDVLDKDGNATGRTVAKRKNDGLFGNTFLKTLAKYAPDAKKYGLTGIIAGAITPLGPLGGVMAGLAASWIKNNKTANDFIFGDEGGLLNKDRKAKIKKALPAIGTSVLATMFLGPFGLMGNAVLGSALGMLSTTEYFKRMILGSKGKDGSRHGGLAGAIRAQITNPFKKFMEESKKDFRKWWHDEVFRKLARGLPSIGGLIKDVVKGAGKSFMHYLDKTFNVNISGFAEKWMNKGLAGVRNIAKLPVKLIKGIGKGTIGALASGVQNLGQLADDIRLRRGNIENMTTYDRLELAAKRGNLRYAGEGLDRWVSGIKNEGAINELAENLEILGRIHDNWGAEQVQRNMQEGYHNTRNVLAKFNEMGKFDSSEYGSMLDAIQKLSQLELKNTDDPYGAIKNILDYNHNINPEEKKEIMEAVEEYYKEGNRNRAVAATFSNSSAMDSVIQNILKNANAQGATVSIDEQDLMSHAGNWARQLKDEVKLRKEKLARADEKAKSEDRIVDDSVLRFDATGTSDVAGGIRRDNETLKWMVRLLTDPKTADSMTANQWAASVGNVIAVFADQDKYTKMMRDQETLRGYHQRRADAKEKKEKERVSTALEILNADETIAGFADNADAQNAVYNVISNGKGDLEQEKNMLVKDLELVKRSHDQGNKAQILDISKILDTDEDGKLMHRVAVLTSMGLSVPAQWYEDLQDLTETAFKCVSKLVGMGFRFTNLEDFKEITDSNEDDYKVTALMELAYTKVAELDGGEKIKMADFKTANEIFRRLSDDEEFRARYITGHYQKGGMQSLVDELSANPNHRQDWTHRSDAFNEGAQVYNYKNRFTHEEVNDAYNKIGNADVTKITGKAALNPVEEEARKLALAARNIAGAGLYVPYAATRGVLNHIPGTGSLKLGNEIENGLFNLKTALTGGADSAFTWNNDYYNKYGYEDTRGYSMERLQNLDEYVKARLGHTFIGNKAVDTSNAVRNIIDDVTGDTENLLLPQYSQLMKDLADGKIGKLAFIDAINDIHNAGSHAGGFFGGLKNLGLGLFAGNALSGGSKDEEKKDDKDKDKEEIEDVETGTKAKPLSGGDITKSVMDAAGITGSIGVADSKVEIGKDGRETKTVNTQYGEITMVRSSADGDWQIAQTKNNQEIVQRMEEDRVIKRGSYEALKKIAENTEDDDNKLKKGSKAAAGGSLFDMFKDLAKMPGDMLSSLGNALGILPLLGMMGLGGGKNKAGQRPGRRVARPGAQGARAGAAGTTTAQTGKLAKLKGLLKGLGNKAGGAALIYLLASSLLGAGNAEASELYETDENGDTILDANGEPIPASNKSADGMSETYESKGLLGSAWDAITDSPWITGAAGLWAGSKILPKVHGAYNYVNEGYKQHVANQNTNAATAAANAQREQWKDAKASANKQFFDNRKQIKMLQGAIKNLDPNDPNYSIRKAQFQAQIDSLERQNISIRGMHKQANRNMRNITTRPVAQSGGLLTDAWAKVQGKLPSVRMPGIPKALAANPRMTALLGIGGALAGGLAYSGSNYAQYQGVTKDVKQAVGLEKKYFNGEDFGLTDLTPEEQAQADYMTMKNGNPTIAYNWITHARESNGGKPIHFRSTNDERIHDLKNLAFPDNGGFTRAGLGLAATSAVPFIADKLTTRTNGIYQGNTAFRNLKFGALGGGLKTLVDAYYGDINSVGDAVTDLGKNVGIATAFNYGIDKAWNKAARNFNAPKVAHENAMAKLAEANKTVSNLQAQVAKDPHNQALRNQLREAMTNQNKLQLAVDSGFNRATSAAGKAASTAGKVAAEAKALNTKMPLGLMLGLAGVNYLTGDAEASAGNMNKPGTSVPEADQSVLSSTLSAIHGMVLNPKHSIAGMIRGNIADSQAHGADMSAEEMAGNAAFTAGAGAVMNSAGHLVSGIGNSGLAQAVKGGVNAARSGGNFFTGAGDGWSSGKFSLKDIGKNIKSDYKDTFNTAKYIVNGRTTEHALLAEEQVVRTKIRDAFAKFANSIKSFIPSERLANAVQGFGELIFQKLENKSVMKRVLAAISKSMAGSIPVLGWALTAGMGVMEAYAGWNNAETILKIPRGSASDAMKLMCAVISGATALPFFGIALAVLMNNVVELTIDSGLFCSRKEIEALRKQADPKYESKEYETKETFAENQSKELNQNAKGPIGEQNRIVDQTKATASETQSKAAVQATTGPIGEQNKEVSKHKNKDVKDLTKEDLDKTAPKSDNLSDKVYQGLKSTFASISNAASSAWDTVKEAGSTLYHKFAGEGKYGRADENTNSTLNQINAKARARMMAMMSGQAMQNDLSIANMSMNIAGDTEKQTAEDSACGPVSAFNLISSYNQDSPNDDLTVLKAKKQARMKEMIQQSLRYKAINDGIRPEGIKNLIETNSNLKSFVTKDKSTMMDNISTPGSKAIFMGGGASAFGSGVSSNDDLDYYSDQGQHYVEVENVGNNIAAIKDPQDGLMFDSIDNVVNRSNTGVMVDKSNNKHSNLYQTRIAAAQGKKSMYGKGSTNTLSSIFGLFSSITDKLSLFSQGSIRGGSSYSNFSSSSSNAGIKAASEWAESMVGKTGYGNNGCTTFVREYLKRAGNKIGAYMEDGTPIADQLAKAAKEAPEGNGNPTLMWVPTFEQWAKDQKIFKPASGGGAEGDVCVCNDHGHVVIADGKGGCWGNSSSRNEIVHYDNIDDCWSSVEGYIATGSGNSVISKSTGNKRSKEEMIADAGTSNAGNGKYDNHDISGGDPTLGLPTTFIKPFGKGKFGRYKDDNFITDIESLKTFDNPFGADIKQATETSLGITPSLKKHSKILGNGKFGRSKSFGRGTEIPQLVWNYFEPKYGPVATAAIMGNMWQESKFDPTAVNELGASGLAQWYQGRNDNMRAYAQAKGVNWTDPQAQLEFLESEIQGNPEYKETLARMQNMTPEDAAVAWEKVFERSGGSAVSERKRAAREAFEKKGAINGKDVDVSISSPSSEGISGGIFGSLFGKVGSMIDKMKAPVVAGMKAFGGAFSKLLGNSPFGKMASLLFGADNPLSGIANMFSGGSSGGAGATNNAANNGKVTVVDAPLTGSAADAMLKMMSNPEITSHYGPRGSGFHSGIDIGVGEGTQTPTPVDGVIDDIGYEEAGYGKYVVVKDAKGNYHIMGHLSDTTIVSKGQNVNAGTIIAKSGNTGHSSGPHIHYGIYPPSNPGCAGRSDINPETFMIDGLATSADSTAAGMRALNGRGKYGRVKRISVINPTRRTKGTDAASTELNDPKYAKSNFGLGKYGRGELTPLQQKLLQRRYKQISARMGKSGLRQTLMSSGTNFDNFGIPIVPKQAKLETKVTNKSRLHENEILDILMNRKSYKNKTKSNFNVFDTKVSNRSQPIFGGMFDSFKNVFNTTKMSDKQTEIPDVKQPETKVTNRTEYDFDNMSFEEMKQAYSTLDPDSVTNKENIPDWDNDALNVIRSKMKSLFKDTNNKLNTEHGNKVKEDKQSSKTPGILDGIKKFGTNVKDIAKSALTTDIDFKNKVKDTDKKLQNKIVDVIDRTNNEKVDFSKLPKAPNGKEYTKNDVEYLLKNGYNLKDALDLLSKDKKYTEKDDETKKKDSKDTKKYENLKDIDLTKIPKAPNGKEYSKNDISYLIGKGYTLEDAIKLLSEHEKYAKKEDKKTTSTGAVDNKDATQSKTVENTSDEINLKILEATNRTNELLAALLQAVTGNYEKQQQAAEATVKQNRTQHKIDKLNEARNTINMMLSPSGVGLGRAFSGANQSSGATKIIPALNAMATM